MERDYRRHNVRTTETSRRNNNYAADFLVFATDIDYVTDMHYKLDGEEYGELSYRDFIHRLIAELQVKRSDGYVRLYLYPSRPNFNGQFIAIFIRKRDLYVVGVQDTLQNVYEVREYGRPRSYFYFSMPTGFGEKYWQLFGSNNNNNNDVLYGQELGFPALDRAIRKIIDNEGNTMKWRQSIGVFALMWSECARFKWFQDVLFVVMRNHPTEGDLERFAPDELRGSIKMEGDQYGFMSKLPRHPNWRDISECARQDRVWANGPQQEKYTANAIAALKNNKRWAIESLSIQTWASHYRPGYGYGGGDYFRRVRA